MASDRLRRNAKASYMAYSLLRYGDRAPLRGHGPLIIYAHELDGCPRRSMAKRASHIDELRSLSVTPWSHNMDRGDSFEQGRGMVHSVPQGITMELRLQDVHGLMPRILAMIANKVSFDIMEHVKGMVEDHDIILSGTPDFMALQGDTLWIMDAKSPRKPRRDEDGKYAMKASRASRLETYVRLARHVLLGRDGHELAMRLHEATPWPIRPGRLQPEGTIEDVHGVIVLDAGESYEFLELHVSEHELEEHMVEKLAKALTTAWILRHGRGNGFLGMNLLDTKALKRLTMSHDEERSWQCGYCLLAHDCPMAKGRVEVVRIKAGTAWERKKSKKGMEYYKTQIRDMEVLTTDEELVKTSQRHDVRAWVKDSGRVSSRSVMEPIMTDPLDRLEL